jgi:hypothetical protein
MMEILTQILPFIWGGIGGIIIEVVDFYWRTREEELDLEDAKTLFWKKYPLRISIAAGIGGIVTYAISLTPAPIWQIVIGMSALGIVTRFRMKKY